VIKQAPLLADDSGRTDGATSHPYLAISNILRERPVYHQAIACGSIRIPPLAFNTGKNGPLVNDNMLSLAEAAGIIGAKTISNALPTTPTPHIEHVTLHWDIDTQNSKITAYAQTLAFAKTSIEISALAAVNAALLTLWDIIKNTNPNLNIENLRLLIKSDGVGRFWINPSGIPTWLQNQLPDPHFLKGRSAAILVMSDRASKGEYSDDSGNCLKTFLGEAGADITSYNVIPDDANEIEQSILKICCDHKPNLLVASGGTGPGPRDITPDILAKVSDRMLHGLGDVLRRESLYYTDTAWLSRTTAGMVGATLVIALPGSPKAVKECWDILCPFLGNALSKIKKQGFGVLS
jgi:cyclic pyranopterin phosphate synthase